MRCTARGWGGWKKVNILLTVEVYYKYCTTCVGWDMMPSSFILCVFGGVGDVGCMRPRQTWVLVKSYLTLGIY